MFLSCHCAITNCDHMADMLKHNISNCLAIDDVKMHCTKCTNITTNVLCPHFILKKSCLMILAAITLVYYWMKAMIFQL